MITASKIISPAKLRRPFSKRQFSLAGVLLFVLLSAHAQPSATSAAPSSAKQTNWTATASLSLKEVYDSDVYMQRVTSLANHGSFVTTLTPAVGAQWKPDPAFSLSLGYSPEIAWYHEAASEDYVTHRGTINLGGKIEETTWELLNAVTWIDGNRQSPTFFGPGGAPALGGVPLRDRRAAFIYRNSFKLQYPIGNWFLRPAASVYVNDYLTEQHANPVGGVYQNYADRSDINGGLDVGYKIFTGMYAVLGYRHGSQSQATVLANPVEYSNTYDRALAGIEGKPADWIKFSVAIGPDFRSFGPHVPAGFDQHKIKLYLDAAATVTLTKLDSITFAAKRFEQPGYGGASIYEDATYEVSWRHKFNDKWTAGAGFRALNWNFELPVVRNEWWYNANASVAYNFTPKLSAELSYGYDQVESLISNTAGREATRHLLAVSTRYSF